MKRRARKSAPKVTLPDAGWNCPVSGHPDLAALARLYWSPPRSELVREDLLERARLALAQYDLDEEQLEATAPLLASALHMLIEQNGGNPLPSDYAHDIERHVLEWCGCGTAARAREEAEERREYRDAQPRTSRHTHIFPRPSRGHTALG